MNEKPTDLTPILQKRRRLSIAWLVIGSVLSLSAVITGIILQTCKGLCIELWSSYAFFVIFGPIIMLVSTAGLVTTLKSYLNHQKRSLVGTFFGLLIVLISLIYLHFFSYNSAHRGVSGIIENSPWICIGFVLLSLGLNFTLKSYRLKNKVTTIAISLLVITIVFVLYTLVVLPMFKQALYPGM